MNLKTICSLIFCIGSATTYSQFTQQAEPVRYMHSIQTNVLSLIRFQHALNLEYRFQDFEKHKGYIVSLDLPLFLKREPAKELHRYQNSIQYPSFDLKLMFSSNFSSETNAYFGIGLDYGFNQYRHKQVICLSSSEINGTCICNQYADNTFSSSRHRIGLTMRFGVPIRFSENYRAYVAFQPSFSYIIPPRVDNRLASNQCGEENFQRPLQSLLEFATFNAQNPYYSGPQVQFHIHFILTLWYTYL